MNREKIEELAALHALGILEDDERREFEKLLRTEPEARQLAGALQATAASLAHGAPGAEPPAALKQRVLAALPDRAPARRPEVTTRQADAPARGAKVVPFSWIPWAVAACLTLACGVVVRDNMRLRDESAALARQAGMDSLRIAVLTSMIQGSPDARAVCVWNDERQEGVLTVENLPPPSPGKAYQLWVVDPNYKNPLDGGVFTTDAEGRLRHAFQPRERVQGLSAFAVSLERQGGVPVAEGPMVLITTRL